MSTLRHFKLMAKSLLLKYKNKSAEPAGARGEGGGSEVRYCFFALFLSAIIRIWTSENTQLFIENCYSSCSAELLKSYKPSCG